MGDVADDCRDREDERMYQFQDLGFDQPDSFDSTEFTNGPETPRVAVADPLRPEAKRGRYTLPNPDTGKSKSWQRVSNFVKMTDDTYHLELWKQRNVAKGVAMLALSGQLDIRDLAARDVKEDRDRLNNIAESAQDIAEAYKMSDEGTALHKSCESVEMNGGDLNRAPEHHRTKVRLYLDALATNGLTILPHMVERVTVSNRYECAGKFDNIYRMADGSYVLGDKKTGDSLDLALPGYAAQLDAYRDGINTHGIFDGQRYDTSIKVRDDFAIIVHLPSTRDEASVIMVDLDQGARINASNLVVREARRIKARHLSQTFTASAYGVLKDAADMHWIEQMNAAHTYDQLVGVAKRAKLFGQWNERLAGQARIVADELGRD